MRYLIKLILFFSLHLSLQIQAQHLYQLPKPLVERAKLEEIIGPLDSQKPSQDLNILWVYGYDEHHIAGAHDYVKVKDLMMGLLSGVPEVTVDEAFGFPNDEQFEKADLVVMYLHLPQLKKSQFASLKNFIANGGGVVCLHETAIMRPASKGKMLSECLGSAWNEGTSTWGAIFDEINIYGGTRLFDFVGAVVIGALALPLIVVIAAAIRATELPVVFSRSRIGSGRRSFKRHKFRTMISDSERVLHELVRSEPEVLREGTEKTYRWIEAEFLGKYSSG